ncbi:protein associated with UVRAG as autophagy enhancer [Megalops cyprinoides]|uniref:protein associated with UVRAG as autophagy enhancer n=1 Tax=Megalops cyprinoides TaxID=118141 RepID=UPI00186461E8|nr:protein associated with UVRAG as autophagy enhancer [Megalops cyprinoides]
MLLSVLESSGGAKYQPLSQTSPPSQRTSPTLRDCSDSDSSTDEPDGRQSSDSDDDGYSEGTPDKGDTPKSHDGSLLDPEAERGYFLPRSSPVISRRKRLSMSEPAEQSPSSSPPAHIESPASTGLEEQLAVCETLPPDLQPHPSQLQEKPRCVSLSASVNWLLSAGLHLPFRGVAGATRGQEEAQKLRSHSDTHIFAGLRKDLEPPESVYTFDDVLRASSDLEKENAHFIVVDMVLEAVEGAKWEVLSQHGIQEVSRKGARGLSRRGARVFSRRGNHISARGAGHLQEMSRDSSEDKAKNCAHYSKKLSLVASCDSGYSDFSSGFFAQQSYTDPLPSPITETPTPDPDAEKGESAVDGGFKSFQSSPESPSLLCSAEVLALRLVSAFRKQWFPREDQRFTSTSLGSALQEFLPSSDSMASEHIIALAEEIRQKSRMRGTLTWAPPRFQIIFNTHPAQKRSVVMASQHYLCAGCGTQVEEKYIKKLRYCEYLGRYFCDCCHGDGESVIPGHVLEKWDFGRYPVCNFSKRLLDSVWHQPLFSAACVGKALRRARELARFRELQEQLSAIKKLLTACRLSDGVLREFEQLPCHLTQEPYLFSMDDLLRVKRGQLVPQAKALLQVAIAHVDSCQLCLAKGFICEFCKKKDVLFPFQTHTTKRCKG